MSTPMRPLAFVMAAVVSVQFGGALAGSLIQDIGPFATVALRLVISAVFLALVCRPSLRRRTRGDWRAVASFGVSLAAMNALFYSSLAYLPLGVAVTCEFIGPLCLAAWLSRSLRDGFCVAAAAAGVWMIAGSEIGVSLDPRGVVLALLAGACWAWYVLTSRAAGAAFARLDGLSLALIVASVAVAPLALVDPVPLSTSHVAIGAGIALLSSVIPYSLELLALRHVSAGVFGVLLSLEPAVAALAGFLVLGQVLGVLQLAGMACVIMASVVILGAGTPGAATSPID